MMGSLNIGHEAEQLACQFLEKKGMTLLVRNYRCAMGEIDLIMRDTNEVVFVEVRKRNHNYFATAVESVTRTKQNKLIKTAMHFLQKQNWLDTVSCRFDIVGFSANRTEWIKDAFSSENFL